MKITLFTHAVLINVAIATALLGCLIFYSSPLTPLSVAISGIFLFPFANIIMFRKVTQEKK